MMTSTPSSTRFREAARQFTAQRRHIAAFGALALAGLAATPAQAAGTTHQTTTVSGNWSAATWTNGTPNNTTAGDLAQYSGTAASSLALDIPVTIGQLRTTNSGTWTITAGVGSFALDNTGGIANAFANNNAFVGTTSSGSIIVNPALSIVNTDLDIGGTAAGAVTIGGAITSTSLRTLTFRANGTGNITDTGAIGATGSGISIVNASTSANKTVTLSGAIGGATGTGAPVTISNTAASGGTAFLVSGVLGATVSGITQNGAASTMTVSGTNNAAGGFAAAGSTGTVTVMAGTLKVGSVNAFGAVNALTVNGGTFDLNGQSGNITVGSLTDGGVTSGSTLTDSGTSRQLVVSGSATSTFGGLITAAAGIATAGTTNLTLTNANTFTGGATVGAGSTLKGTDTSAFGTSIGAGAITNNGGTLILANDGAGSNGTIVYGPGSGYNVTASSGTIAVQNNGGASTGNTVQLGQLTFTTTGTVSFTNANGYGVNFAGGLTEGAGTGTLTVNTNATPVTMNGIALTAGKSLTVLGTGALTSTGPLTISSGAGTASAVFVGSGTSGGNAGNLVLRGTASTITGGATVAGGSLTLFNADSLGGANAISLAAANGTNGTTGTATLNLRNDADTLYGNNVTATSAGAVFNVDQATAGNTGHTLTLGTLTTNQTDTFTNGSGYNLAFGAVSSTSAATFTNNMTNGTLTLASFTDSAGNAQNLIFNGTSTSATTTVTGVIAQNAANALGVKQTGSGKTVLDGANTYTGVTTISAGELRLDNGSGSGTGTGAVNETGGALSGTGSETSKLTVTNGAVLAAGDNTSANFGTVGTLGVGTTGGATLTSAALDFDFSSSALSGNDLLTTGGTLGLGTLSFTFNELSGTLDTTNPYTLISGAGSVTGFNVTNFTTTFLNGAAYTPTYTQTAGGLQVSFAPIAAAPEPSSWAALLTGALGVGGLAMRARRRLAAA